jgi:hypothetical protein
MIFLAYIFSPDVWGTVSDWFAICLTAIGAMFVYLTFRSQKEVQKKQNYLFEIESIRFEESIKPVLKYMAHKDIFKPGDENKYIITIEITNVKDNAALEISRIAESNEQTQQIFIPTGFSSKRNHLSKGDEPLLFHFLIEGGLGFVVFALTYQDIAGTRYKQVVYCTCDNQGIDMNPFLPEKIDR